MVPAVCSNRAGETGKGLHKAGTAGLVRPKSKHTLNFLRVSLWFLGIRLDTLRDVRGSVIKW